METAQQRAARRKADAVKREKYIQRLRTRLQGMKSAGEIWRAAYLAGHHACYAGWLRRIHKGEVIVTKPRRDREFA